MSLLKTLCRPCGTLFQFPILTRHWRAGLSYAAPFRGWSSVVRSVSSPASSCPYSVWDERTEIKIPTLSLLQGAGTRVGRPFASGAEARMGFGAAYWHDRRALPGFFWEVGRSFIETLDWPAASVPQRCSVQSRAGLAPHSRSLHFAVGMTEMCGSAIANDLMPVGMAGIVEVRTSCSTLGIMFWRGVCR